MKYSLIKGFSFTLLTIAFLTVVPHMSYGQWILGGKVGYNFTQISGSGVYGGMNKKPGFDFGVVISKKLKVDFAFESGIFFSQAGVNQKFVEVNKVIENISGGRLTHDTTIRHNNSLALNYIKVPLMLRKSFSIKGGNLYPYRRKISITDIDIMVGPYVSYLLSASATFNTVSSDISKDNDGNTTTNNPEKGITDPYHQTFKIGSVIINNVDSNTIPNGDYLNAFLKPRAGINKGLSKFDVGITAAIGISVELSADSKLMIGGNYSKGFLTIDKEYFSTLTYTISPGGSIDVGGGNMATISKKVTAKADLKNSGMGFYIAYVKYLR